MRRTLPAIGFAIFAMIAAYRRGLFFDKDFYSMQLLLFGATLAYLTCTFLFHRKVPIKPLYSLESLLPFIICITYALLLAVQPESVLGTWEQLLRWISYGCFLFLIMQYAKSALHLKLLHTGFIGLGLFILAGAWLGFYGVINFPDIVVHLQDERLSIQGMRLSGFFQYANMFAAVMSAFLLYQIITVVTQHSNGWLNKISLQLPLVPYITAILLTESRAAWLMLFISWLLGWIVMPSYNRRDFLVKSMIALIGAGWAYRQIINNMSSQAEQWTAAYPGSFALLLATAGSVVIMIGLEHSRTLILWRSPINIVPKLISPLVFIIGTLCFIALLPATIQQRATGNYDTATARKLFYEDAWAMIKQSPWIGSGGDGWRTQYTAFQQQPYVGTEVHSGYLDMMLDTGILGMLLFTGILLWYAISVYKRKPILLPPLAMLFGHSLVDFDMSYGFFWFMALWLIGMGLRQSPVDDTISTKRPNLQGYTSTLTIIMFVLLLVGIVIATRFELARVTILAQPQQSWVHNASRWWNVFDPASKQMKMPIQKASPEQLHIALQYNPYFSIYREELAKQSTPEDAIIILKRGLTYEPHSVRLLWALGLAYGKLDLQDAAYHVMIGAIELDRYDYKKQTSMVQLLNRQAQQARYNGDRSKAIAYANKALKVYHKYSALIDELESIQHPANGRKFTLTSEATTAARESEQLLSNLE